LLKKLACSDHNWFRKQHLHEVKSALRIRNKYEVERVSTPMSEDLLIAITSDTWLRGKCPKVGTFGCLNTSCYSLIS